MFILLFEYVMFLLLNSIYYKKNILVIKNDIKKICKFIVVFIVFVLDRYLE